MGGVSKLTAFTCRYLRGANSAFGAGGGGGGEDVLMCGQMRTREMRSRGIQTSKIVFVYNNFLSQKDTKLSLECYPFKRY